MFTSFQVWTAKLRWLTCFVMIKCIGENFEHRLFLCFSESSHNKFYWTIVTLNSEDLMHTIIIATIFFIIHVNDHKHQRHNDVTGKHNIASNITLSSSDDAIYCCYPNRVPANFYNAICIIHEKTVFML